MHHHYPHCDQENRHPNRVQEGDISKFSKQYVLEGERLKVKSILYRERPNPQPQPPTTRPTSTHESKVQEPFNPQQYEKLQYLDQLGVLNLEEKKMLKQMKEIKRKVQPVEKQSSQRQPLKRLNSDLGIASSQKQHQGYGYGGLPSTHGFQQFNHYPEQHQFNYHSQQPQFNHHPEQQSNYFQGQQSSYHPKQQINYHPEQPSGYQQEYQSNYHPGYQREEPQGQYFEGENQY